MIRTSLATSPIVQRFSPNMLYVCSLLAYIISYSSKNTAWHMLSHWDESILKVGHYYDYQKAEISSFTFECRESNKVPFDNIYLVLRCVLVSLIFLSSYLLHNRLVWGVRWVHHRLHGVALNQLVLGLGQQVVVAVVVMVEVSNSVKYKIAVTGTKVKGV